MVNIEPLFNPESLVYLDEEGEKEEGVKRKEAYRVWAQQPDTLLLGGYFWLLLEGIYNARMYSTFSEIYHSILRHLTCATAASVCLSVCLSVVDGCLKDVHVRTRTYNPLALFLLPAAWNDKV